MRHSLLCLISSVAFCALFGQAVQANADKSATGQFSAVVELFTSQGCSSCPPADRLLKTYVDREDVLALTFPVDYWDYLGWKDTFASPQYSKRQRDYAASRGDGAVYTPQAVINGSVHMNGSNKRSIEKNIKFISQTKGAGLSVPVSLTRRGKTLLIQTSASNVAADKKIEATIWLASVQKSGTVNIGRGENHGRKVTYHNIVRQLAPIGMWKGEALDLQVPEAAIHGEKDCAKVVLIQEAKAGPIIGAAWLSAQEEIKSASE